VVSQWGFADGAEEARDDEDGEVDEDGKGGFDGGDGAGQCGGRCGPGGGAEGEDDEYDEGGASGEVDVVEADTDGYGDRAGERADGQGGNVPAEEVAPSGERGGSPAFEDPGFSGGDEADAAGVPGGEGEAEGGRAGDGGG
jgi:hypothetical protein